MTLWALLLYKDTLPLLDEEAELDLVTMKSVVKQNSFNEGLRGGDLDIGIETVCESNVEDEEGEKAKEDDKSKEEKDTSKIDSKLTDVSCVLKIYHILFHH